MKRSILFDANPLIIIKSGVGYLTERLIDGLATAYPDDLELIGHYFNFSGRKDTSRLPSYPNLRYIHTDIIPTKLLNLMRRAGIEIPFELFARTKADVVLFPNFVSMPTAKNKCTVVAVHDLSFIDCPQYVSERNGSYLRKWVPVAVGRADIILTISEFTKSRIMEFYKVPAEKIHVMTVPPAIPSRPDTGIFATHNIPDNYLLFVGTLEPRKNITTLLSAYDTLPAEIIDKYALVLVGGKGWKDEELLIQLNQLRQAGRNIITTGYVTEQEKAALYGQATLCIQPSHYEGFGMPILEAMSYQKPVLCSDLAVFHEVAGEAAVYFETENPGNLAFKIADILNSKQQQATLINLSAERMQNVPDWQSVARGLYTRMEQDLQRQNVRSVPAV